MGADKIAVNTPQEEEGYDKPDAEAAPRDWDQIGVSTPKGQYRCIDSHYYFS